MLGSNYLNQDISTVVNIKFAKKNFLALGAAVREAREEVGAMVNEWDLALIPTILLKHAGKIHKGYFFATQNGMGEAKIKESDKCAALNWFYVTQLPNII